MNSEDRQFVELLARAAEEKKKAGKVTPRVIELRKKAKILNPKAFKKYMMLNERREKIRQEREKWSRNKPFSWKGAKYFSKKGKGGGFHATK